MPFEIGLLSTQQDSFEHHEELSKLLNETDVFYVPLRNEFGENDLHTNQDLTKCFDEDLSNRHLIVTFRDIGYSLFLDSVESIPDENDRSKMRVSGKMIVDGICIQFLGCFDYAPKNEKHSESSNQQINGVGRVELDEEYYRELSSAQISSQNDVKSEIRDVDEEKIVIQPIITHRTRQQTVKSKERIETMVLTNKPKTRSRTSSESILTKTTSISPPSSSVPIATPLPHTTISTTRPRIHSPTHMPYPLRSPRTKQYRPASPVHAPPTISDVRSSFASPVYSTFNQHPLMTTTPTPTTTTTTTTTTSTSSSINSSQVPRIQIISQSPHFPSSTMTSSTMPMQIPTSSNTGLPTTSLPPPITNLFPLTQSHSLPAYFLPATNIAYITTAAPTNNPSASPFDLNAGMLFIAGPSQHPSQPIHFLTSIDHPLQFAHYTPTNLFSIPPPPPPPPLLTPPAPSRTCNILETMSNFQNKRPDNDEDKRQQASAQQQLPSQHISIHNKQPTEQLPFKKRRYTGQQIRMATVHDDDDDEVSDESVKK